MNALVVEDEENLAAALGDILKANHWNVDVVHDGQSGLNYAESGLYDAIVLDVMLPKLNGFEVCSRLRSKENSTPILMLTARSDIASKVHGLDCGADDYLTKPFDSDELLARLRAITRRSGDVAMDRLTFGDLALTTSESLLECENGKSVRLSQRECSVMEMLMRSPNSPVSKNSLLVRVWGPNGEAGANNVEAYVSFLRKKLSFLSSRVIISTIRMLGYRLDTM